MRDPFEAVDELSPATETETREQRIKRHGHDPHDTAYRDHAYPTGPIELPEPLNPEFIAAQRKIEAVIHDFRRRHPELDSRTAWIAAGKSIGIEIEAIAVHA